MTYAESIEYLYSLRLFGLKLGLDNTRKLAALAGNPQEQLRFIHIAGTNGKGSVAAMLESVYRVSGLRVGLYTSPHLVSFRERIQVNRQQISATEVVRLVAELGKLCGTGFSDASSSLQSARKLRSESSSSPLHSRGQAAPAPVPGVDVGSVQEPGPSGPSRNEDSREACPTFFEFVTVMALRYFVEQRCDLVIWETGLGGRLDATNIVTPLASVITNIEPDHQRWLGHELRSIATEKAGIIKKGVPTITATSEPEALAVIQETALRQTSPLTLVTPADTARPPLNTMHLPLLGSHQQMNAATAMAAVQVLQTRLPVSLEATRSGLTSVRWPGRLQLIQTGGRQRVLLDGAHNASGATCLRAVLEKEFGEVRPTLVLGVLQDKDWQLMCEVLAPVAARIICVPVRNAQATDPQKLAEACRLANRTADVTVTDSLSLALGRTKEEALTVVAGSIYLVGEALNLLSPGGGTGSDEQRLNEWGSVGRR